MSRVNQTQSLIEYLQNDLKTLKTRLDEEQIKEKPSLVYIAYLESRITIQEAALKEEFKLKEKNNG